MNKRLLLAPTVAALVVSVGAFVAYPRSAGENDSIRLRPDDREIVAHGGAIYKARCAVCHGASLEGQPHWRERGPDGLLPAPPHDESGHTWHHPDELLFRITKHGFGKLTNMADYRTAMPVYEGVLSDDDIVAVLSWIKAQWPQTVRERHDQINAQYRQGQER